MLVAVALTAGDTALAARTAAAWYRSPDGGCPTLTRAGRLEQQPAATAALEAVLAVAAHTGDRAAAAAAMRTPAGMQPTADALLSMALLAERAVRSLSLALSLDGTHTDTRVTRVCGGSGRCTSTR
jgi:hypothetical protein